MTLAMTRCGTPFWTAPEIIQGGTYNESVDQYAFGCVCLEILTGSPPWQTVPVSPPAGRRGGGNASEQMAPLKVMQVRPVCVSYVSLSVCRLAGWLAGSLRWLADRTGFSHGPEHTYLLPDLIVLLTGFH